MMQDTFQNIYIHNSQLLEECPPSVNIEDWKKFRDKYKKCRSLEFLDSPSQIDIELNGGCNMSCPFCLHGYTKRKNTLYFF